jgi:cell fate regulator YaaT (PSP1 superfamily)
MQTVLIRLRKPTRVFTFLSDTLDLKRHDDCVVQSDRGMEYGTCILPPEACPVGMEKRYKMNVVRKASPDDESTFQKLLEEEDVALRTCKEKVAARKLRMKLVDAEFTFDKQKLIFYFTAEDRVDFRQLVRDLAQQFKTRIELRHIQVRDEAKIVGGLGVCGRELCCSTFLREFKPISMKMAKRQNLSLNPTKISGQCGRLLCCLSYENDMYQRERRKEKPKPSDITPDENVRRSAVQVAVDRMREAEKKEEAAAESGDGVSIETSPEPVEVKRETSEETDQTEKAAVPETKSDAEGEQKPRSGRRRRRRPRRNRSGGGGGKGGDKPTSST